MTTSIDLLNADPTVAAASELAARLVRLDGWQNVLTNLAVPGKDPTLQTQHVRRPELDPSTLENMYREDALFARIINAVPENCVRRWINFHGVGGSKIYDFGKQALSALEDLDAQNKIYEFMRLDRLYGGSLMLLGVSDGRDISEPVDESAIASFDFLNVLSRWEVGVGPLVLDPTRADHRQPEYYTIGSTNVHPSRVLRLRGIQISDRVPNYAGWGFSIGEHTYDACRRFATIYGYMEGLFKDLVQGVFKIEGLSDLLSADDGNNLLIKRMQLIQLTASVFNSVLLDTDETYERRTATFTGIREGVIAVMDELAAVAEMPLSILFGQPPAGLSTDDSGGRTAFYDSIANKQRRTLRAPLNRIASLLMKAKNRPIRVAPKDWSFSFLPLTEPTETDQANRRLIDAQALQIYVETGLISPNEARSAIAADPSSPVILDPSASSPGGGIVQSAAERSAKAKPVAAPASPLAAGSAPVVLD